MQLFPYLYERNVIADDDVTVNKDEFHMFHKCKRKGFYSIQARFIIEDNVDRWEKQNLFLFFFFFLRNLSEYVSA